MSHYVSVIAKYRYTNKQQSNTRAWCLNIAKHHNIHSWYTSRDQLARKISYIMTTNIAKLLNGSMIWGMSRNWTCLRSNATSRRKKKVLTMSSLSKNGQQQWEKHTPGSLESPAENRLQQSQLIFDAPLSTADDRVGLVGLAESLNSNELFWYDELVRAATTLFLWEWTDFCFVFEVRPTS